MICAKKGGSLNSLNFILNIIIHVKYTLIIVLNNITHLIDLAGPLLSQNLIVGCGFLWIFQLILYTEANFINLVLSPNHRCTACH